MPAVESSRALTRLTWPAAALLALASLCAACSNNPNINTPPTAPSTPLGPGTETMNGLMAPNGTAIRTFTASQSGTVTVLLAKTDPPIVVGLGVGIRDASGAACNFSQTVNTPGAATPQLSVTVDPGTYCAGAYDVGNVGQNGVFVTITVTHP